MKLHFTTLGCKVNQYETQALQTLLAEKGHKLVQGDETADVVVINTCAVTAESTRKSRQAVKRARGAHPGAFVAVCGCVSQISPEDVADLGADLVAGSGDRRGFARELERLFSGGDTSMDIDAAADWREFEILPAGGLDGRMRALLKVQDGCDNYCTYCIIPYARGPVRSIPSETAVEQAKSLEKAGFRELTITGIEISSYGKDRAGEGDLIDLVEAVCKAVPQMRVRLGSLEPRTVTEDFCDRLRVLPNLCPHFHLSLQSGCDVTLHRMGRRYDTARYLQSISWLRQSFEHCGITTDLIVGFPGESEADFQESVAFLKTCAFSAVHIFPYSAKKGTKAAEMPGQIEKAEKTRRAKRVGQVAKELRDIWLASQVGSAPPVLFESEETGRSLGHTPNYCTVSVPGTGLKNQIKPVAIHSVLGENLEGTILLSGESVTLQ
ncbi:MAG: tRNA (N(6)-L-threonylcarbamoyladenosine(37)-C(2))-methylthiotransferase MtaB [Oscillospiraceae bacterium]|nr:tRNA (N(6)-L-threonylcarbamoyladenosine(37)-C(2))-methylthiotransferase MtaB [Oscillospiraceae bacterium]